jgi:uncharacterized protein (TIGR01777 family)
MRPNQTRLQADHLGRDADARSYAADLVRALKEPHTVLVTGATGFIGSRLAQALAAAGHDLIVLTRNPAKAADLSPPFRLVTDLDQLPSATRIDAIVNLAGEPLGDGIWTRGKRRRIMASRLRVTAKLVHLIARLKLPPKVLISASAISWYGRWQDEVLTEFDGGKRGFTHRVCEAWEQTARRAQRHGVRVVRLRIGQVLGTQGGLLRGLLLPFRLGLGGAIGSGTQWLSWIERDDLVRLIAHCIVTAELRGPVNGTAPTPVRNRAFAQALGRALARPAAWRFPAVLLQAFAGDLADELLLGGQQVLPAKILASGFEFRHPTLASALADLLGAKPARRVADAPPQPSCAARQEPAGTATTLARVASPALQSGNRVAPASVELARSRD